jgi:hypothetical protein
MVNRSVTAGARYCPNLQGTNRLSAVWASANAADGWQTVSDDDEAAEAELGLAQGVEQATASPATDVRRLDFELDDAATAAPGGGDVTPENISEYAVSAALAGLSQFVESLRAELPSDFAAGSAPEVSVASVAGAYRAESAAEARRQTPDPGQGPADAVKQLGLEVARVVEIMDARIERTEIVGANQLAELRSEMEELIVALLDRIEAIEDGAAMTAGDADDRGSRADARDDPDHLLFENPREPDDLGRPHALTASAPSQSIEDDAAGCSPSATENPAMTALAAMRPAGTPDESPEAVAAEATDAARKMVESAFWKRVRDQLFSKDIG